jgi:CheY-like chemotaxis protein
MRSHASALVLEDNEHMRFLLSELLYGLSVEQVDAVASIGEAKSHISYLSYDFALVDIGLGAENGLDFVRSIRLTPDHPARRMPVIVVSGQNQVGTITSARDAGADAFLAKPISETALAARVKQVLDTPRNYVEAPAYFGPDRRRGAQPGYRGPERRRGAGGEDWYV